MDNALTEVLRDIEATPDLLERAMKLTGLVTGLFRAEGWDLVVVGGSAIEFYEVTRELG